MRRIVLGCVCGLPLLVAATSGWAQSTEDRPAPTQTDPSQDDDNSTGLDDVIVTAQRRSENLQRAAVAVSAVTSEQLTEAGVTDINNLTRLVPSLVVQPQGGASTNFYLRGVGSFGTNAFAENAVAFNFAGVYVARPTSPLGTLFDLERIEVVKGPQGTLYGRNATGGAINVIPRAPRTDGFAAEASVEWGNYETAKASGAINIPLGQTLALRLAGQAVDRGAYLSNNYDDESGQAARASLLWQPSETFSLNVIADYFRQRGRGVGSVLIPGATAPDAPPIEDRISGSDSRSIATILPRFPTLRSGLVRPPQNDGFMRNEFYGLTAVAEADLGFATLTVIPAYRRSEPNFLSYTNGFLARVKETDDQYSLEARLASNSDGPFGYVVGAYYFDEEQNADNTFSHGPISTTSYTPRLTTTSQAVFAQLRYALSDTFRVIAGGRYTTEDKSLRTPLRSATPANPNPVPLQVRGELSFESTTWKVGVEWDAGPQNLVYANVATGFKAGGFFVSVIDNASDPEELIAYTVGSKNRFLDNRLQLNAELFYWDYRDQQVSFVGPAQFAPGVFGSGGITVNAGNATMYGADVDLMFQLTEVDFFTANVQFLESEYDSFRFDTFAATGAPTRSGCPQSPSTSVPVNAPARLFAVNCAGRPALNAPKWALNLSYEHDFLLDGDLTLSPSIRARVESSRYLSIDYLPETLQKGYSIIDLGLTLRGPSDGWTLAGYVNNATDETILASAAQRGFVPLVYGALRPPRTFGVRLSMKY